MEFLDPYIFVIFQGGQDPLPLPPLYPLMLKSGPHIFEFQKPRFQDKNEESNITIQTNLSDFQKPRFQDKYVESNITIQTNLSDFQKPRFQDKNKDSNITIQANLSDFQKPRFQDKYEESNITSKTNLSIYTVYKRTIKNQQWVIINGWHLRNLYKNRIYLCCLLSQSKETRIETVSKRKTFGSPTDGRLAFQHQCKLENISDNDEIIAATLVWRKNGSRTDFRHKYNALCPKNKDQYRLFDHVVVPEDIGDSRIFANLSGRNITSLNQNGSDFNLAICAKLAYGNLDVNLTIEWMEYHRYVNVLHIASTLKLVSNVRQLFAADDFSRRHFSDAP